MRSIERAAVIGAGTMGHGIAYVLAESGIKVCLIDNQESALDAAQTSIDSMISVGLTKNKLASDDASSIRRNLSFSTQFEDARDSDLLIEAVSEDIELKQQILSRACAILDNEALIATNTSSLSITRLAQALKNKERFLGLHFFNPPHIMKLLEIVVHGEVDPEALEVAKELSLKLRKESIVVNDSPGFATSRLGISFSLEAIRMLETGVSGVLELDTAMKLGYGHPMGPLMLTDWVGLDVRLAISEHLYRTLDSQVFEPPALLKRMVRAGLLGKKTGTGFYEWDRGRHLGVSQAVIDLLH